MRVRDGEVLVSDGPFAETKEQIGGYDVVECPDLDTALRVAAGHPLARTARVEVRLLVDLRSQSRLRLEGRTRTLSGPSPDP